MEANETTPPRDQKKRRITQADLARLAGVSPGVVSAALYGSAKGVIRVSPSVVKKIRDLAKQEGYTPNHAARQLASQKSKMWGVLCSPTPNELNAFRLSLLHEEAKAKGYQLIIEYIDGGRSSLKSSLEIFQGLGIEGVVCLHHFFPEHHSLVPTLVSEKFDRVVFIDKPMIGNAHFSGLDYVEAGRLVYRTLRQNGKRPGLILQTRSWYAGPFLIQGFTEEWSLAGSSFTEAPIWIADENVHGFSGSLKIGDARHAVEWAISEGIDGLAVSTDEGAAFICNALREQGLQVPQDIAVIGQGNSHFCELVYPALSSIDFQQKKIIRAAVETLHQLCKGNPVESSTLIQPHLQLRASCSSAYGADCPKTMEISGHCSFKNCQTS